MISEFWLVYGFVLLFAVYSIIEDITSRKVSNTTTLLFFILSFAYFLFSLKRLSWPDFIALPIFVLIIYYIYKKEVWGAADGKILISVMLVLTAYGTSELFLNYILNLIVFYSVGIILVILFITSTTDKKNTLKKIDFKELLFVLLFVFLILRMLLHFFPKDQNIFYILGFIVALIFIMRYVYKYLKVFYGILDENSQVVIMFSLSCLLFYVYYISFLYYFSILFAIKAFLDFVFKSIEQVEVEKNYQSPFTVYIFLAAIFTLFAIKNIVEIIVMVL